MRRIQSSTYSFNTLTLGLNSSLVGMAWSLHIPAIALCENCKISIEQKPPVWCRGKSFLWKLDYLTQRSVLKPHVLWELRSLMLLIMSHKSKDWTLTLYQRTQTLWSPYPSSEFQTTEIEDMWKKETTTYLKTKSISRTQRDIWSFKWK